MDTVETGMGQSCHCGKYQQAKQDPKSTDIISPLANRV